MPVEFGILGPLEVTRDGRVVELGATKQRALLAMLLIHANRVVPLDHLVDDLWGAEPPARATNAVQVYVSALRRLLEPDRPARTPARLLVTRPPGYLLQVTPDQLDILRFECLVEQGRQATEGGDAATAAGAFAEALDLWRGPALADVAYEPFAEREAARLEELRLRAIEERVEADLALGRHADLVGELETLVAAEPLRERLSAQLMLALYRCGRQAEALRAYQKLRGVLGEELGIEPSGAIRALEEAILLQKPELDWVAPTSMGRTRSAPPTGVVTFLLTDIEGSTRLLAALGDAYPAVLADHRALIRAAVAAHRGHEHATNGDGLFVIFPSARDAVAAAVEAQLALRRHNWPEGVELRVRMGVHAGEVGWSDDDVVGMAVHEAARIADAAHGGQVLVSPTVRDIVGQTPPEGVSLLTRGVHRLKDLAGPIELFQLCHPQLRSDFPPPRTAAAAIDIPVPRTSFVGREHELPEVLGLLSAGRHLTLTGIGGSGKTRLALEAASRDAGRHADGVFFVDLAPVGDPELVLGTIARAVKAEGDPSDLEAMLLTYLSRRRALLIFDNCEHLLDACADALDLILARCPHITVLATSREALRIEGEQTYPVPSLGAVDEVGEAVQLFVSRARAVAPSFELTDANRAEVLAICQRLDGIPLAIELAAARVAHLGVGDIARRLDERFDLLVGSRRRRAQRQQTLQAAMDWSWGLLRDEEKVFLRRLAVFAGSFTLEAAETVCGTRTAVDVLASLVAKSLVNRVPEEVTTRYRLLETVRLYAQDSLVEAGEAAERRQAHRDYYLARFEAIPWDGFVDLDVLGRCIDDQGNHRAALDWSSAQEDSEQLARLAVVTGHSWSYVAALQDECRRWLLTVAEDDHQDDALRANACAGLAHVATLAGDISSMMGWADRAQALGPSDEYRILALFFQMQYDEAALAAERIGAPAFARFMRAWAIGHLLIADAPAALEGYRAILAETVPEVRGLDRLWGLFGSALARLLVDDGPGALADALAIQELEAGAEVWAGSLFRYAAVIEALALGQLGRADEARAALRPLVTETLRDRYPQMANDCLVALAYIAAREGDQAQAAALLEPVLADGRLRVYQMYFFVMHFLSDLHDALAGVILDPPLPTVGEFFARIGANLTGAAADTQAAARIEAALFEFVS